MTKRIITLACMLLLAGCASSAQVCPRNDFGRFARSRAVVAEFKQQHPCPATGATAGPCKGWVIDHVTPLCACDEDTVSNLQWQTAADAQLKARKKQSGC